MRRLMRIRSSSLMVGQRVTSSKVRKQLRHTSSPSTVVQCPMHGLAAVAADRDGLCRMWRSGFAVELAALPHEFHSLQFHALIQRIGLV